MTVISSRIPVKSKSGCGTDIRYFELKGSKLSPKSNRIRNDHIGLKLFYLITDHCIQAKGCGYHQFDRKSLILSDFISVILILFLKAVFIA